MAENYSKEIYPSDLKGSYQRHNIKTVLQSIAVLKELQLTISIKHAKSGLLNVVKNTGLLGRWQVLGIKPKIICDIAHNKEGLHYTLNQLSDEKYDQLHIVLGVVKDKNLSTILPLFPKNAIYYFCQAQVPRALDVTRLRQEAKEYSLLGRTYSSVAKAFKEAKRNANPTDLLYIGGSTFVVAEIL